MMASERTFGLSAVYGRRLLVLMNGCLLTLGYPALIARKLDHLALVHSQGPSRECASETAASITSEMRRQTETALFPRKMDAL